MKKLDAPKEVEAGGMSGVRIPRIEYSSQDSISSRVNALNLFVPLSMTHLSSGQAPSSSCFPSLLIGITYSAGRLALNAKFGSVTADTSTHFSTAEVIAKADLSEFAKATARDNLNRGIGAVNPFSEPPLVALEDTNY